MLIVLLLTIAVTPTVLEKSVQGGKEYGAEFEKNLTMILSKALRSRSPEVRYYKEVFDNTPSKRETKVRALHLMKQAIYRTQERMRNLYHVIRKYENSVAFRMAFIFGKLTQLELRAKTIYTKSKFDGEKIERTFRIWWTYYIDPVRFYKLLIFYTWMVKTDIDVTYVVEFLRDLHNRTMAERYTSWAPDNTMTTKERRTRTTTTMATPRRFSPRERYRTTTQSNFLLDFGYRFTGKGKGERVYRITRRTEQRRYRTGSRTRSRRPLLRKYNRYN